jgi:hypothetical protein
MANPQYLWGNIRPRLLTVATAQVVGIYDMVALVSNTLVRAGDFTWTTDLATTQTAFTLAFAGLSNQAKTGGIAKPYGNTIDNRIVVCTGGCWEMDCASADYKAGTFVGPAKQTGDLLETTKLAAVATAALAIGRVITDSGASATRVRFELISVKLHG